MSLLGFFLLGCNAMSQTVLTPRLLFDYDEGDLFHYHKSDYYNFSYQGGFSVKVLGKLISAGNDSVTYYIQKNSYTQAMNQNTGQFTDTVFSTLIDTITYTDLDTDIALLPQYNTATFQQYQSYFNSYAAIDSSCLFGMYFSDTLMDWNFNGELIPAFCANFDVSPSTCNSFVSRTFNNRFGKGLGIMYFYQSVSGGPSYGNSYNMVYFKKDTLESGNPDWFLSDVDEMTISELILYPNPCANYFHLDLTVFPSKKYTINLLNAQGKVLDVLRSEGVPGNSYDVSDFPEGMYFYQLFSDSALLGQGKFIIDR